MSDPAYLQPDIDIRRFMDLKIAYREKANELAWVLEGNLRDCGVEVLCRLKKELKQFNAHTGEWK